MITEVNAAVEFEVSMGIYGNKMDKNAHPSCSTTHPTNAVYDGQVRVVQITEEAETTNSLLLVLLLSPMGKS